MLAYAVYLELKSPSGIDVPTAAIAKWLTAKLRTLVTPTELQANGKKSFQDPLASRIEVERAETANSILISVRLTHADSGVSGRQWVTEVGLRYFPDSAHLDASLLVETREISTRVTAPAFVRPPRLLTALLAECPPRGDAIHGNIRTLSEASAPDVYRYEVLDRARRHPLVLVSPTDDGSYCVSSEKLKAALVGLAEVFIIPQGADTFAIARSFEEVPAPYHGAVSIVFPRYRSGSTDRVPCFVLNGQMLTESDDVGSPEDVVLANVTHRTNLPMSWRHISPKHVADAARAAEIAKLREAVASEGTSEAFDALLEQVAEENHRIETREREAIADRDREFERAEELEDNLRQLRHECETLKDALFHSSGSATGDGVPEPMRSLLERVIQKQDFSVAEALELVCALYPERVLALESARTSAARVSHFRYPEQVLDLLLKLATTYWKELAAGKPDGQARSCFGQFSFAAKEANLSTKGRNARTFVVPAVGPIFMEPHLKIQRGYSAAESWRCHFEWLADRKLIVIGHCGEHLPE